MTSLKILAVALLAVTIVLVKNAYAQETLTPINPKLYDNETAEQTKAYNAFLAKVMDECGPNAAYALKLQMSTTEGAEKFQGETMSNSAMGQKLQEGAFNDFLRILTACPDTVNHRQSDGVTPLIETASMNNKAGYLMGAALIRAGANVNAIDGARHSVLYNAMFFGNFLLVKELIDRPELQIDKDILDAARKFIDPVYVDTLIAAEIASGNKEDANVLLKVFAPETRELREKIVKLLEGKFI